MMHLSLIVDALLWVTAFAALAAWFREGRARAPGRLGAAGIIVGVAIHIVDASINGFGAGSRLGVCSGDLRARAGGSRERRARSAIERV